MCVHTPWILGIGAAPPATFVSVPQDHVPDENGVVLPCGHSLFIVIEKFTCFILLTKVCMVQLACALNTPRVQTRELFPKGLSQTRSSSIYVFS